MNLILSACGEELSQKYLTDNPHTECCYYPDGKKLVVINNSDKTQKTTVKTDFGDKIVTIEAFDTSVADLG